MTSRDVLVARLARVAQELGDLADEVTVVGGTSPALYPMNEAVALRPTLDVDVILRTASLSEWHAFVAKIQRRGFKQPHGDDVPICRYVKADLTLDVMPSDPKQLGFGNRWYDEAARQRIVASVAGLHVVAPIYFIATKLDAFEGRGADAPMMSHDLEDIFVVVRGLPGVVREIETGNGAVHAAIRGQLRALLSKDDAIDIVHAMLEGDAATQSIAPRLLAELRRAYGAVGDE